MTWNAQRSALDRILGKCREANGCWEYTGTLNQHGYCRVRYLGRMTLGHRLVWELMRDPIPDGLAMDHLCRNRACVNPDHLDPVPQSVNAQRVVPKTECPRGHQYTPDNVYWSSRGSKYCRKCHLRKCRERRG